MSALLDVPEFIARAKAIYGYDRFVCDSGGSLCEVVDATAASDPVLDTLAEHTMLVYIAGTEAHTRELVERFRRHPKPMYYDPLFLERAWDEYKAITTVEEDEAVDPDGFAVWGFEQLIRHRVPLYEAIAARHGYTIQMSDVAALTSEADVLELLARAVDAHVAQEPR
jgi:hypothetical protein